MPVTGGQVPHNIAPMHVRPTREARPKGRCRPDENLVESEQPGSFLVNGNRQVQRVAAAQSALEVLQIVGGKDVIVTGGGDYADAGLERMIVVLPVPDAPAARSIPGFSL